MPDNTINELISKILKNLDESITVNIVEDLYSLGEMLIQSQKTQVNSSNQDITFVNKVKKFTSLSKDKGYIDSIKSNIQNVISKNNGQNIFKATSKQILNLSKFYIVWKGDFFKHKYGCQPHKDKNNIPKEDRRIIHIGIFTLFCVVFLENENENENKHRLDENFSFAKLNNENVFLFLKKLNNDQEHTLFDEASNLKFLQEIKREIAGYIPPSKTKTYRVIKVFSILLAVIVALTSGLATGGAIYLFFAFLHCSSAISIGGGALTFFVGVWSNYGFFSSTLSNFFRVIANGTLMQYIDNTDNKRKQIGGFKKWLLVVGALILSLSVGVVSAALLVKAIIDLLLIVPFLGSTLPLILGSVLGLFYGVGLTIAMFYAFVNLFKTSISPSAWFKDLEWRQILGYLVKIILIGLILFGIGFGCHASFDTLKNIFKQVCNSTNAVINICISLDVSSFIGQVPFVILSVNKFYNMLDNMIANWDTQKKSNNYWITIINYFSLTVNALGNAALVFIKGSISSIFAVFGIGLDSFTGNMSEPMNKEKVEALKYQQESISLIFYPKNKDTESNISQESVENSGIVSSDCSGKPFLRWGTQFFSLKEEKFDSSGHEAAPVPSL